MVKNTKKGITLMEIILAMAILAIVVIMMTPVLVSGFKQIVISGNRNTTAKVVAGEIENMLAGLDEVTSEGEVVFALPNDVTVEAYQYSFSEDSQLGSVNMDVFKAKPMTITPPDPTEPGDDDPGGEDPGGGDPGGGDPEVPTLDLTGSNIQINVDGWRYTSDGGTNTAQIIVNQSTYYNKISFQVYHIIENDDEQVSVAQTYSGSSGILSGAANNFVLSENNAGVVRYVVEIYQNDKLSNKRAFEIALAPVVRRYDQNANTFYVQRRMIAANGNISWREIKSNDTDPPTPDDSGHFKYDYLIVGSGTGWTTYGNGGQSFSPGQIVYVRISKSATNNLTGLYGVQSLPARVN